MARDRKDGGGRTEHGEDADAKVVEDSELLHVAFLELLFGERKQFDLAGYLCRIDDGDAGRYAFQAETTAHGSRERIVHRERDVAYLDAGGVAFRAGAHGREHLCDSKPSAHI